MTTHNQAILSFLNDYLTMDKRLRLTRYCKRAMWKL